MSDHDPVSAAVHEAVDRVYEQAGPIDSFDRLVEMAGKALRAGVDAGMDAACPIPEPGGPGPRGLLGGLGSLGVGQGLADVMRVAGPPPLEQQIADDVRTARADEFARDNLVDAPAPAGPFATGGVVDRPPLWADLEQGCQIVSEAGEPLGVYRRPGLRPTLSGLPVPYLVNGRIPYDQLGGLQHLRVVNWLIERNVDPARVDAGSIVERDGDEWRIGLRRADGTYVVVRRRQDPRRVATDPIRDIARVMLTDEAYASTGIVNAAVVNAEPGPSITRAHLQAALTTMTQAGRYGRGA